MVLLTFLPEISTFLLFIMMGTQLPQIGPILILLEFALVGLLFAYRTTTFVQSLLRWWPLLLMPILATLSGLWSDLPMMSARYGAQYLFTAFVGVLLARLLTPRRFVTVLMLSLFAFCILCILNGRLGSSAEGWVLIGLTGSKNQMAYAAQLLMLSATAVLLMRQISPRLRVTATLAIPLSIYLVFGTNSATALLMAFGGVGVLLAMWFSERLPPGARLGAMIAAVIVLTPFAFLIPEITAFINHFVFDTLNKDPTLTGRTILWDYADDLIARRPLLGYGFQAAWMSESTDALAMKRLFGVTDGRTFHFHHQFRQIAVDTGLIGLLVFSGALIVSGFTALRQFLVRPDVATSFFFVVFMLMVARAFTDVIVGPFSIHTILFFAACVYAFWRAPNPAMAPAPTSAPGRGPHRLAQGRRQGWRKA